VNFRQRPAIFFIVAAFTLLSLWYAGAVVAKFHFALIVGALVWGLFLGDYLVHLTGKSVSDILQSFPPPRIQPGTKKLSYDEIIQIYVKYRREFYALLRAAQEARKTNKHQFVVFALFFSGIVTAVLYLFRAYFLFSVFVVAVLILPGAIRNDLHERLWILLFPYLKLAFDKLNISLQNFLNAPVQPGQTQAQPSSVSNRPSGANISPPVAHRPSQVPVAPEPSPMSSPYQPGSAPYYPGAPGAYSRTTDNIPTGYNPAYERPSLTRVISDSRLRGPGVATEETSIPPGPTGRLYDYTNNINYRNPYNPYTGSANN
jgi:hypothetical protein